MTVRSRGVGELATVELGFDGAGVDMGGLVVVAVDVETDGLAVVPVGVGPVAMVVGVVVVVVVVGLNCDGVTGGLASAPVMSRPARSMANHAVADTPATVTSHSIAMTSAERTFTPIFITMSLSRSLSLCHFRFETPPTG
jgi:hypothetical protein